MYNLVTKFRKIFLCVWMSVFALSVSAIERGDIPYRFEVVSIDQGLSQHDVSSIVQDKFGFIWIATYNGLNRYDGYKIKTFRYNSANPRSVSDNRILRLFRDSKDRLWVATDGGGLNLYDYEKEDFTNYSVSHDPVGNNVYSIYQDQKDDLWLGTAAGLYKANIQDNQVKINKVNIVGPRPYNIRTVTMDARGNIYLGTLGSVFRLEKSEHETYRSEVIINAQSHCIIKEKEGNMWIGTSTNLIFYNHNDGVYQDIRFEGQALTEIRGLVRLGDSYIVATRNDGIYKVSASQNSYHVSRLLFESSGFSSNSIVKALFIDDMKNLWVGSGNNGAGYANLLSKPFFRLFSSKDEGNAMVNTYLPDSRGYYWVRLENKSFEVYRSGERHQDPVRIKAFDNLGLVNSLTESTDGSVWACSGQAIYRIIITGTREHPDFNIHKIEIPSYLLAEKLIYRTITHDKWGNIWVGAHNGVLFIGKDAKGAFTFKVHKKFGSVNHTIGIVKMVSEKNESRMWMCSNNIFNF